MTKAEIRERVKLARTLLTPAISQAHSVAISKTVAQMAEFVRAKRIALYLALPGEVSAGHLLRRCLSADKKIALPCHVNGEWGFSWMTSEVFVPGPLNTRQPHTIVPASPDEMDLLLIPCVAVDPACGRIGHGKGIYDRLLRDTKTPAIGIAFDFQVFESVPMEPHDRRLDKVVTERRVFVREPA
ncbi:MAG: 5-formyltetrahydrofolate cyclo-ligase [Kiritimatiellia bacterium]